MQFLNVDGALGARCKPGSLVDLGKKCVICGTPDKLDMQTVRVSYWPKLLIALMYFGIIPFVVAVLVIGKSCQLRYGACPEHKKTLNQRMLIWAAVLCACALGMIYGVMSENYIIVLIVLVVLLPVFALYWHVQPISVKSYDDGVFVFEQINPEHFATEAPVFEAE